MLKKIFLTVVTSLCALFLCVACVSSPTGTLPPAVGTNPIAMQTPNEVLSVAKSYCVTNIEILEGSKSPYLIWAYPHGDSHCGGTIPAQPTLIDEIDGSDTIKYQGHGIIEFQNVDQDLPVIQKNFKVLDVEELHGPGYYAVVREL